MDQMQSIGPDQYKIPRVCQIFSVIGDDPEVTLENVKDLHSGVDMVGGAGTFAVKFLDKAFQPILLNTVIFLFKSVITHSRTL
jgi:hypothetical protein